LNEPLTVRAILGGLIVMGGVWITGSERQRVDAKA